MVSDPYFRIQFKMESKKMKQEKSADSCAQEYKFWSFVRNICLL